MDKFGDPYLPTRQGAYNSGKHRKDGNLREFLNSGKLREFIRIYRIVCIIVSNSSVNWLSDTATGVDGASHHAPSINIL